MSHRFPDRYTPDRLAPCPPELRDWLQRELGTIARLLERPRLTEHHAEPAKPEPYVLLVADGVSWNPGAGRGVYFWDPDSSSWEQP